MPSQKEIDAANLAYWNELAEVHSKDDGGYRVAEFLAGQSILDPLLVSELGSVEAKSLLHLQCHFGLDSLCLARLGAEVTGIDYAKKAIALARQLSENSGVPGRFVHGKVEDAPDLIEGQFDLVFTSWGAICWLPDLTRWAQVIAHFLKPGSTFYMIDGHPLANAINHTAPSDRPGNLALRYSCLSQAEAMEWHEENDYVNSGAQLKNRQIFDWNHDIGTVVTALCQAGLTIEFLHEHPVIAWQAFPDLVEQDRYFYALPEGFPRIPLSFSLKAGKAR